MPSTTLGNDRRHKHQPIRLHGGEGWQSVWGHITGFIPSRGRDCATAPPSTIITPSEVLNVPAA